MYLRGPTSKGRVGERGGGEGEGGRVAPPNSEVWICQWSKMLNFTILFVFHPKRIPCVPIDALLAC